MQKHQDQAVSCEFGELDASVAVMSSLGHEVKEYVQRMAKKSCEDTDRLERGT